MIDFYCSWPHYADHLRPIYKALPTRGVWHTTPPPVSDRVTVVASYGDLKTARAAGRPVVYSEHGAGFSYSGDQSGYAGGWDRAGVVLILAPNEYAAKRNRAAHPTIPQVIVGSPKLDGWWTRPPKPRGSPPVVAVSFHFETRLVPEARGCFAYYQPVLAQVARAGRRQVRFVGHGHPRIQRRLRREWRRLGWPFVADFDEVATTADLYVVDTSSTAYEFAALDRPVLTLNAPWYRRHVEHGLRFWQHIPGLTVDRRNDLWRMIVAALTDPPAARAARRAAVEAVYPFRDGGDARRAAAAITDLLPSGACPG